MAASCGSSDAPASSGPSSAVSELPSTSAQASVAAEPSPTPTPAPTPSPSPVPTVPPTRRAWTAKAVEVLATPPSAGTVQVHLGANYQIEVTANTWVAEGGTYVECLWRTLMRTGSGWIPEDAVASEQGDAMPSAGIDALDTDLQAYVNKLGDRVGVQVYDVTRGMTYSYNSKKGFLGASSTKVSIMLTFLSMLERKKREPTAQELSLLTSMIEYSNNDSANALYIEIGGPKPIASYLQKIGVTGITPTRADVPWGYTSISPAGMVSLLDKLRTGAAVNKAHTELALRLMSHVTPGQQIGVGDTRPKGSSVAMKDGWYAFGGQYGTVMNSSGIVVAGNETYIISVYTDKDHGANDGFIIARRVCGTIAKALTQPAFPAPPEP